MSLAETAPATPCRTRRSTGRATPSDLVKLVDAIRVTVSHVLDTPELASSNTLRCVREAVQQAGYTPDLVAGSLVSSHSRLVVALISVIAGSVFQETVAALTIRLTVVGYQLLIGQNGYDGSREDVLLNVIAGRRPTGIVLTGVVHSASIRQKLQAVGAPVVKTWDIMHNPLDMLVGFSYRKTGQAAARCLKQRGTKRPAVIMLSDRRTQIHAQAFMKVFGSEVYIPVMAAESPANLDDGRRTLDTLLEQHPDTDAIFCDADIPMLGMLMEAERHGIVASAQLRVVGYGNQMFVKNTAPALTATHIDGTGIGKLAATLLINRIEHDDEERRMIDAGFTLAERDST